MNTQPELPLSIQVSAAIGEREVAWFISELRGRDWTTAAELLIGWGFPVTEQTKRRLRSLAEASGGQIGFGQRGYKLVVQMTKDEHDRCRNTMLSQVKNMERRVIEMDRVFYGRQPAGVGV